jgi:UDP-glucose 4-epimerase
VELVEYTFAHGEAGDVFIHKASACTIGDLAAAVSGLFGVETKLDRLGIRHGEKRYETLASHEEMARAQDLGGVLRVPLDARDLNYGLYFDEGDPDRDPYSAFTSQNAPRLDVPEIMGLLRTLPEVRAQLELAVPA